MEIYLKRAGDKTTKMYYGLVPVVPSEVVAGVAVAGGEAGSDGVVLGMFIGSSNLLWSLDMTDRPSFPFCESSHEVKAFLCSVPRVVASTERAGSICKIWMI